MKRTVEPQMIFVAVCSLPYVNALHLGLKAVRAHDAAGGAILFGLISSVAVFASLGLARNKKIKD